MKSNRKTRGRPLQGSFRRERVTFTLSPEDIEWLNRQALAAGVSKSRMLERILHEEQRGQASGRAPSRISLKLPLPPQQLADFCRRHRVSRLSLFGSVLTDEFRDDSDVDVLVEFESGHSAGLFEMVRMEQVLSSIFSGRKVDLRTAQELSRYFRDEVLEQAEVLYAA